MASVGVGSDEIDIKKAGTFPIVHGMRDAGDRQGHPGRLDRRRGSRRWSRPDRLEPGFGRELRERAAGLHGIPPALAAAGDAARHDRSASRWCSSASLTTADRDILRDALRIVRQFREIIRNRYHLGGVLMMRGALRRLFYRASLGDHAYRFLFEPGPPDEVVALDCETTGLDPRRDDIIAVAAVRIRGNRILTSERFEAIVRPDRTPTCAESIKVHQLRAAGRGGWAADAPGPSRAAALHRRPPDRRLLHRFRRPHAGQVRAGPDRGEAAEPAIEVSEMYYAASTRRARPAPSSICASSPSWPTSAFPACASTTR